MDRPSSQSWFTSLEHKSQEALKGDMWGGKEGSICHFAFSLVLQCLGGLKIARCWEKQHEKCHYHAPFCVPQMLVKTRTWEQCPRMPAGQARGKWQIDPIFAHIQGGHLKGGHLNMGFRTEVRTWKWDFALQFALDTSILIALSKGIAQARRRLDREGAV